MSEQDIRAERQKKLEILRAAGMEAYPVDSHRDTSNADALASFDELEESGRKIHLGGRVMSLRGQGGIMFADIFDGTGRTQVVVQADSGADITLFEQTVDTGDFVEFSGTAFKTKRGKESLKVTSWRMLAKSLLPMPTEHFGIKDEELRLRERYLDILLNPETRAMFERRARFWFGVRAFMITRGFLEVEPPILETSPGGADARPFITHHNALDIELYRHIVKEVYGKYTFDINGHTVDFAEEWPVVDFCEAIKKEFGINPSNCAEANAIKIAQDAGVANVESLEKAIDGLWKKIRVKGSGPAFLVGVPVYLEPLAKRSSANPSTVDRFQVLIAG